MKAWLKTVIKPVHRHPAKQWYEFSMWHEPFAPLQDTEHGIVRRMSSEAVTRNGLVLSYDGDGAANVRVQ